MTTTKREKIFFSNALASPRSNITARIWCYRQEWLYTSTLTRDTFSKAVQFWVRSLFFSTRLAASLHTSPPDRIAAAAAQRAHTQPAQGRSAPNGLFQSRCDAATAALLCVWCPSHFPAASKMNGGSSSPPRLLLIPLPTPGRVEIPREITLKYTQKVRHWTLPGRAQLLRPLPCSQHCLCVPFPGGTCSAEQGSAGARQCDL